MLRPKFLNTAVVLKYPKCYVPSLQNAGQLNSPILKVLDVQNEALFSLSSFLKFQTLQMRPAHGLGLLARTLVRGNRQVKIMMI